MRGRGVRGVLHREADFLDLVVVVDPPHDQVDLAERNAVAGLDVAGKLAAEEVPRPSGARRPARSRGVTRGDVGEVGVGWIANSP